MKNLSIWWIACVLFGVTLSVRSLAAPAPGSEVAAPAAAAVPVAASAPATLRVFNRDIFTFRGNLLGVSASDRARRATARVYEQLEANGTNTVTLKPESLGTLVQIDGQTSFLVMPEDIDPTEGHTVLSEATDAKTRLEQVISESRESRDVKSMLRSLLMALAATAVGLVLRWAAGKIRALITGRLLALSRKHSEKVSVGGIKLLPGERVAAVVQMGVNGVHHLFLFVLFYNWLSYVLSSFPFTRAWGEALSGFLLDLITNLGGAIVRSIPGIATAIAIFYIARWANRLLNGFFERVRTGQIQVSWLDADVVVPTRRITTSLIWLFALAMSYPYLPGSDTEAFKGLSVLAGLMISLGASNLVGQAASGLILTYGRVFRKGEFVAIAEHEGTITELGMFTTRIRTGLGEEVTIANTKVLDSTTKNYSRAVKGAGFVLDTTVTIGYDTPWRQVNALLIEAARRTDGVLADPAPTVFQTALSDWYPQYRLVCQAIPADPRPRALLLSSLLGNIQDVFNEYGVQIMSPQYFEDPPEPKIVKPENWYPAPAEKPPQA